MEESLEVIKYKNGKDLALPSMNYIVALFILTSKSWASIFVAWGVVIISIATSWEVPASGAVLICGVIIAEILYEHEGWRKMPTNPTGSFILQPDGITGFPVMEGEYATAPATTGKLGALISLSKKREIQEIDGYPVWFYLDTVKRVEKPILYAVVLSAVCGTGLWGYGHLIFK